MCTYDSVYEVTALLMISSKPKTFPDIQTPMTPSRVSLNRTATPPHVYTLEVTGAPDSINRAHESLCPTKPPRINTDNIWGLLALLIPPDAVLLTDLAIDMRILVSSQTINPRLANNGAVEHYIDFLAVKPRLRILVAVSLDANMLVDNHDFHVAGTLLLFCDDGVGLVFANIEEVVEPLLAGFGECCVHFVDDHLVGPTLHWEEFTSIIVSETDVAIDVNSSFTSFNDGWDKWFGIQCW